MRRYKFFYNGLQDARKLVPVIISTLFILVYLHGSANAARLRAGVAKMNITNLDTGRLVNDSLYVRALVFDNGSTKVVIISVDAISVPRISRDYLTNVRTRLQHEVGIKPSNVLINTSHLHWETVSPDIEQLTIRAVKEAHKNLVPVNIGFGTGYEDRIMESRRLLLRNGKEWTIRHANPMPPCEEVTGAGPVDPEIGVLRVDKKNGETLAVVFNYACHPYQGVPSKGITADFPGIASRVIEDNTGDGTVALFLQGFGGDITTVLYKDVNNPRDAGPLGNMLGLSTLQALNKIECGSTSELRVINEIIKLPRRTDLGYRVESLEAEQANLLESLRGTSLNIKTFIPLYIKYNLFREYPSYYSHRYFHDDFTGSNGLKNLDAENRRNMDKYLLNIHTMEKLTRIQENIYLLRRGLAENESAGEKTIDVEVQAIRIGELVLVTFPGEVSVQVGLNIKNKSPFKFTYLSGYTNGSIFGHYAPTVEQYKGEGYEDSSSILASEWQKLYEDKVSEILNKLKN